MTAAERAARTEEADRLCRSAFAALVPEPGGLPARAGTTATGTTIGTAIGTATGTAMVAVGGYGRAELAPYSDLDVVLVHDPGVEVAELAQRLWYPLWDAGVSLDHSVRSLAEVTTAAADDVRVALGLLDARHLAGDPTVTLRLRADVLALWRREARHNLPRLQRLVGERAQRAGELAHVSVPDLKDSVGGLRDATVLKALVATWLVDVPHADLERCRRQLLDIRDLVQARAGRASDRVTPELWSAVAEGLGVSEAEAQRRLRRLGRRSAHLARLTWARVDRVLAPPPPASRGRVPQLERVAPGVAVSAGEVVLDRGADPAGDPALLLRAAVVAAERGLMLGPPSAARLAEEAKPLPEPWPAEARDLLVRLLAAGPGLLAVWETLDETGALDLLLPEWERVRLLPHASAVHRFTVDRHVVETCIEASRLIRRVARPDLLLVAALLHDIGKGGRVDHSVAGEPVAAAVATRLGFAPDDVAVVARLVRRHLLLAETATSRDLEDPATVEAVRAAVGDVATIDLLEVLTEADARATAPKAWTSWRAGLVADLARRVRVACDQTRSPSPQPGGQASPWGDDDGPSVPAEAHGDPAYLQVEVEAQGDGARVRFVAADRFGLMADVAGALALMRLQVRSARAWTVDDVAVSHWCVDRDDVEASLVRRRFEAVAAGQVDPSTRIRGAGGGLPPVVMTRHEASRAATVVEVRTQDVPGVVFHVCRALARLEVSVVSAHVDTVGPQALDVFYLQEAGAGALSEERAASAVHAVRRALEAAATLDACM